MDTTDNRELLEQFLRHPSFTETAEHFLGEVDSIDIHWDKNAIVVKGERGMKLFRIDFALEVLSRGIERILH